MFCFSRLKLNVGLYLCSLSVTTNKQQTAFSSLYFDYKYEHNVILRRVCICKFICGNSAHAAKNTYLKEGSIPGVGTL